MENSLEVYFDMQEDLRNAMANVLLQYKEKPLNVEYVAMSLLHSCLAVMGPLMRNVIPEEISDEDVRVNISEIIDAAKKEIHTLELRR